MSAPVNINRKEAACMVVKWADPGEEMLGLAHLAFSLILVMELMSLIFVIPASLSISIGKQFEILTLILLRNAFKELTTLEEPVRKDEYHHSFHITRSFCGKELL